MIWINFQSTWVCVPDSEYARRFVPMTGSFSMIISVQGHYTRHAFKFQLKLRNKWNEHLHRLCCSVHCRNTVYAGLHTTCTTCSYTTTDVRTHDLVRPERSILKSMLSTNQTNSMGDFKEEAKQELLYTLNLRFFTFMCNFSCGSFTEVKYFFQKSSKLEEK